MGVLSSLREVPMSGNTSVSSFGEDPMMSGNTSVSTLAAMPSMGQSAALQSIEEQIAQLRREDDEYAKGDC